VGKVEGRWRVVKKGKENGIDFVEGNTCVDSSYAQSVPKIFAEYVFLFLSKICQISLVSSSLEHIIQVKGDTWQEEVRIQWKGCG